MNIKMDRLAKTLSWFLKAKPTPTTQDCTTQIGVHFEEVAEMVRELSPNDEFTGALLADLHECLTSFADHLKTNAGCVRVDPENRVDYLDALADQLVTVVGCAHVEKMNICGALDQVNGSNFSKFDAEGEPIFHPETRKILKGPFYWKVDLAPFV